MPDETFHHHLGEWTAQTHLAVLHERQVHHAQVAELRAEYINQALLLQKTENDLHFDRLNHEASQLKAMQVTYLPREVYEADAKGIREWRDSVNGFMSEIKGRIYASVWIFAAIVALVTVLQHFWK